MFKFVKGLNNNIAVVSDNLNQECIALGRGISFDKKKNQIIQDSSIDKIFVLKDKNIQNKLVTVLDSIPSDYLLVTEKIVDMIKKEGVELSDMIYVTLVDHISVSIEREKTHTNFPNPLLLDIKNFYPKEYILAVKANEIIKQYFGIYVSDDELGYITMHIVNASSNQDLSNTISITRSVSDIINIIEEIYDVKFDPDSFRYERLVRHLIFLIQRILSSAEDHQIDVPFTFIEEKKLNTVINRIDSIVFGKYGKHLESNEICYLKYHILILTSKKKEG